MTALIETPDFKEHNGVYTCPECEKQYGWSWIRRHVVKEHGYEYFNGMIVYKPAEQAKGEKS